MFICWKHHTLPSYFLSFDCIPRSDIHEHDTRYAHLINVEGTRTKMAENCIRHHLTIILNNTPGCILHKINTHSLQGFSFFIKRYYLNELTYECHLRECYVCRKWIRYDYRKAALGWWLMILQLPGLYVDFYIGICRARMNSLYNFTLFLVFWLVHAVSWGPPPRKSIDYLLKAVSGWQHVSTLVYPPYFLVDSIKLSCVIGL